MKVGDYVRTKYGIKQIYEIDNNKTVWKYKFKLKKQDGDGCIDLGCFSDSDVIKSSSNIIDLIELGDLVRLFMEDNLDKEDTNIFEVIAITSDKKEIGVFIKDCELDFYPIENLRGIVTKEQFLQMEYRIGEWLYAIMGEKKTNRG